MSLPEPYPQSIVVLESQWSADLMKRFLSVIPDVLLVLGLVAVAVGAGLVFLPAGLIVGGVEAGAVGLKLDGAFDRPAGQKEGPDA